MPITSHDLEKDSVQLSKKNGSGSTSSLGSTESCFPNYRTSSLGNLYDISSTASSNARGYSSQTFDKESAYTNESGESAHKRVPPSDKKIKVKRAIKATDRGTDIALRVFSKINQSHGVSYNKKAGVFKTPDVKILPATSKTDKASKAEGPPEYIKVDEEQVKVPRHNEVTPKSILRGRSVPTNSGYSASPQSQKRRPTDLGHSKQQASPYQINGTAPVQRKRNTAGDEYGDFNSKEMAAFNEVIKHNYSQRGQRVESTSKKYEDHRSTTASSVQLAPSDRQRPQQRPTSYHSAKPSTVPHDSSSCESTTAPTTPRDRSPDDIRGRSPTRRRPDVLSSKRKSYERTRPNDREHRQPGPDEPNPDHIKNEPETVQGTVPHFLTTSPPQHTPPPPPPTIAPTPAPRLVYLHCGHPYIDDPSCKNAYQSDPRFEYLLLLAPHPHPYPSSSSRSQKFNAANLSDAALRDLRNWYQDVRAPRWRAIKQHLSDNHPNDREEIGKMGREDVVKGFYVHVHDHERGCEGDEQLDMQLPPHPPHPRGGSGSVVVGQHQQQQQQQQGREAVGDRLECDDNNLRRAPSSNLAVSQSREEGDDGDNNHNNYYNSEKWRWTT